MTKDEALKLALEALERVMSHGQAVQEAKDILAKALAQPEQEQEQEPVGVVGTTPDKKSAIFFKDVPIGAPLYTFPPQRTWVGLTDAELGEFSDAKLGSYDLCLEVEAKLKEKNCG